MGPNRRNRKDNLGRPDRSCLYLRSYHRRRRGAVYLDRAAYLQWPTVRWHLAQSLGCDRRRRHTAGIQARAVYGNLQSGVRMNIRDRITELRRVKASELRPNPKNWRTHPDAQRNALRGVLSEIGYADALLTRTL